MSQHFDDMEDEHEHAGIVDKSPFADQEIWELGQWLVNNVNQQATEDFLRLPIVSQPFIHTCTQTSYQSKYMLMKFINKLPTGPEWRCELIRVHGDRDEHGEPEEPDDEDNVEELELWMCDPIACMKELIGNPGLKGNIAYTPEKVYTDHQAKTQQYDKMWTGDWWWNTQVSMQVKQMDKLA
ncbi:hypothetical protein PISMIDRAFT_121348 [Pisolithus microcarpus 441]|uniref:Uncharacterized protein n=1 Tax=Pisolithus microcarpus 441 TaxID=765257 RepID=A0A0C9Y589_9AGAM|nr:hypothetical protein PISMIDRAFT_121348 [Pisolithus microcarpus 441]